MLLINVRCIIDGNNRPYNSGTQYLSQYASSTVLEELRYCHVFW
jgi:hypothetical protein